MGSTPRDRDLTLRLAAFDWLSEQTDIHGDVPGRYLTVWPVYIIGDDPSRLTFAVAVDEMSSLRIDAQTARAMAEGAEARRVYLTMTVRARRRTHHSGSS